MAVPPEVKNKMHNKQAVRRMQKFRARVSTQYLRNFTHKSSIGGYGPLDFLESARGMFIAQV